MSARTRFEVLKRDGFRCRYCGATALETPLHVDHVIARAAGGTDDPTNLVAACATCNLGKSDKPLDRTTLSQTPEAAEALLEHAEQVRAYLAAVHEVEVARGEVLQWLAAEWERRIGYTIPRSFNQVMRACVMRHPLDRILRALDATGGAADQLPTNDRVIRYFRTCLKNARDEAPPTEFYDAARDAADLVARAATADDAPGDAEARLGRARDIVNAQKDGDPEVVQAAWSGLSRAIGRLAKGGGPS